MAFVAEQFNLSGPAKTSFEEAEFDLYNKQRFGADQFALGKDKGETFSEAQFNFGEASADEPPSLADQFGPPDNPASRGEPTPEQAATMAEYAPSVIAAALGLALPVSAPLAAVGGLALGTLARGATPLLKGEGWDAALAEADPRAHPYQAALEVGIPFAGKAISAGLKARSLRHLADFSETTSLDAALPKVDELAPFADPKTVSRADVVAGPRASVSAPAPYLVRSKSEAARIAGDRTYVHGELERFIETNGDKIIARAKKGLTPVEAETLTQVLAGKLNPDLVTPRIAAAERIMRTEFYDPMGRLAERAGVLTEVKAGENIGEWVPFRMKANFSPEIPLDPKQYVNTATLRDKVMRRSKVAYQRLDDADEVPLMTDAFDIAKSYLGTMKRKIAASHAFGSPTKSGKYGETGEQLLGQLYAEAGMDPLAPKLFEKTLDRIYTPGKPDELGTLIGGASKLAAKVQLGKAALRSIPQLGHNLRQHGVGNTIEGLTRYATDPSMRELIETSGAKSASMADHAASLGVGERTVPMRMQRGIERFNRGVGNAGIVPQMEKLNAHAKAGTLTSAHRRILEELRISPEEMKGEMTADLYRRAIQRSADDNQLQAHAVGQVGDFAHDEPWKALTQYQPFQWAQWRQAQQRMLEPMAHPIKRPAEALMGLRRTAVGLPTVAALSAPVTATYALMGGRNLEPTQMAGDALETTFGTPGGVVSSALQGYNPREAVVNQAPPLSLIDQAWKQPEGIPADLAALLDPTGTAAVLRAPFRAWLRGGTTR